MSDTPSKSKVDPTADELARFTAAVAYASPSSNRGHDPYRAAAVDALAGDIEAYGTD